MVATKLPYPILKYLELSSDQLEEVQEKYPFYLFPKVASLLSTTKSSAGDINALNDFGFHREKLENYSKTYNTIDVLTIDINNSFLTLHQLFFR